MTVKITNEQWLRNRVAHQGDDCLLWPFSTIPAGYGQLTTRITGEKKFTYAHRLMCELAHGTPPTPAHQASHSCHKPGCVNPKHLSWKTASENMLDKRANGTASRANSWGRKGRFSPDQVAAIKAMKGRATLAAAADQFGCTIKTIRSVQNGVTYADIP